jgi:hypothetical protein
MTAPDAFALGGRQDDAPTVVTKEMRQLARLFWIVMREMRPGYDLAKSPFATSGAWPDPALVLERLAWLDAMMARKWDLS